MTEREKWEAGLWYDANFDPELCAEREKQRNFIQSSIRPALLKRQSGQSCCTSCCPAWPRMW